MSQSTTFLLAPASSSSTLPPAPSLSLLPFSLGPSSAPYTSTSSATSAYFRPRPFSHPENSALENGDTSASFRGRQVIGQRIEVPNGYRGVVLGTSKRPDRGGVELRGAEGDEMRDKAKYPLTPASSAPSVASTSASAADEGTRRSTRNVAAAVPAGGRVRGAGQVALAKPRARAVPKRPASKKRFRLDSDDEDEEDEDEQAEPGASTTTSRLMRTPSKRARSSITTPQKPSFTPANTINDDEGSTTTPIPEIVIQEATPLKHPLPTPQKRLSRRSRRASPTPSPIPEHPPKDLQMFVDDNEVSEAKEQNVDHAQHTPSPSSASDDPPLSGEDGPKMLFSQEADGGEEVIPSPSTEDDPPAFDIKPKLDPLSEQSDRTSTESADEKPTQPTQPTENDDFTLIQAFGDGGPIRVLRPVASFDSFVLYTPDVPLAGFRQDELSRTETTPVVKKDEQQSSEEAAGERTALAASSSTATLVDSEDQSPTPDEGMSQVSVNRTTTVGETLQKGWWRSGGAGEGGDEMVRALGEWLGLNEILHAPVYLEDADSKSDEEE